MWVKDGNMLYNDETFQTTQILWDGATSTYNNFLIVDSRPTGVIGTYVCKVSNDISQDSEETIKLKGKGSLESLYVYSKQAIWKNSNNRRLNYAFLLSLRTTTQ